MPVRIPVISSLLDHLNQNLFNYGLNTQQSGEQANYSYPNMLAKAYGPTVTRAEGNDDMYASSQTDPKQLGGADYNQQKDPKANPGSGYFWDAADGWKPIGGSSGSGGSGGGSGSSGGSGDNGGSGGSNTTLDMLNRERDRKLSELEDAFNLANRYGQDARNTLGRKRKGFEEEYNNSASDIYDQFGRNRADLQVSSEGQDARTTRGLLSQGVGGSGLAEALRRNASSREQNYGQVREGRLKDERVNTANKNERMAWADEQDAGIDRYLEQAMMQRNQGRSTTLDNFSNTLGGLISQAQQAAQALSMSGQNIGNTEIEGMPLAGLANGTFLNELQSAYQNSLGGKTDDSASINANLANLSLTEQDKRLKGLLA